MYKDLTEKEKEIAMMLGFNGLFSEKENVQEAYNYAADIANSCGSYNAVVMTALHVVLNAVSVKVAKDFKLKEEK